MGILDWLFKRIGSDVTCQECAVRATDSKDLYELTQITTEHPNCAAQGVSNPAGGDSNEAVF